MQPFAVGNAVFPTSQAPRGCSLTALILALLWPLSRRLLSSSLYASRWVFLRTISICFRLLLESECCRHQSCRDGSARFCQRGFPVSAELLAPGQSLNLGLRHPTNQEVTKSLPALKLGSGGRLPKTLLLLTPDGGRRSTTIAVLIFCVLKSSLLMFSKDG